MLKKITALSLLVLMTAPLTACGPSFLALLTTAKVITAGSAPVLDRLVLRKIITDTQAATVRTFLSDTSSNIQVTHDEWIAANGNRVAEVGVVQNSVNREATAVGKVGNLPPEVQLIIGDVNTAFQVIAAFYGVVMPPAMRPAPGAPRAPSSGNIKKDLRDALDKLNADLH